MTFLAAALAILLTALLMAWGYHRGAVRLFHRWILAVLVLGAAFVVGHATGSVTAGLLAAAALAIAIPRLTRILRRRMAREAGDAPAPFPAPMRWWVGVDRVAGAVMGLLCANACCYLLAIVGSSLVFNVSVTQLHAQEPADPAPPPAWVGYLGEASRTFGQFGDAGLLNQIPRIERYRGEISALIELLNASPEDVRRLVEKRQLMALCDLPPIQAALDDPAYLQHIERARQGRVTAILQLTRDQHTRDILQYPRVRHLAREVTPSQLLAELKTLADQPTPP